MGFKSVHCLPKNNVLDPSLKLVQDSFLGQLAKVDSSHTGCVTEDVIVLFFPIIGSKDLNVDFSSWDKCSFFCSSTFPGQPGGFFYLYDSTVLHGKDESCLHGQLVWLGHGAVEGGKCPQDVTELGV